ncbi:MAG TPA: TA system VapC family ribonuclease toxin [Acidobacteriota bacterium]
MVALLDVNVLGALFDGMHVHHEAAHAWFGRHRSLGWATCPLTENGLVRVLSNPNYPGRRTNLVDAVARLEQLRRSGDHSFWADSISLRDPAVFRPPHIGGYRRVTDAYLLALAVLNRGRLATFDRSIPVASVTGAGADHIVLLPPGP